ncbi:flagellar biosynthetic protein FliO [Roseomonas sp. HJA6]|uniref:Flagellar biosynthetic protein FliO n=1 Tax=Roseomonas alba TaxID=2846776 RepID=A0ABS7A4S5_9PROT|nr:flagellar biosynthetic protein FliO [Neoroseomonas alba]MBW6397299.1 flagellar biosynthetic protein FliO [Neoroseomonas alba]
MTIDPTSWIAAAGALAAVIALILLVGRLARRAGLAPQSGARLRVEETVALDTRRRLVLVRCDGRSLLLLTGGTQDQVVGWLPEGGA